MCSIKAYEIKHKIINEYSSSGGGRPLSYNSTKYVLLSFDLTPNYIYSWLKSLKDNHPHRTTMNCGEIYDLFKNVIFAITKPKPDYYKNKIQLL